jgi:hypothetical protein
MLYSRFMTDYVQFFQLLSGQIVKFFELKS